MSLNLTSFFSEKLYFSSDKTYKIFQCVLKQKNRHYELVNYNKQSIYFLTKSFVVAFSQCKEKHIY